MYVKHIFLCIILFSPLISTLTVLGYQLASQHLGRTDRLLHDLHTAQAGHTTPKARRYELTAIFLLGILQNADILQQSLATER